MDFINRKTIFCWYIFLDDLSFHIIPIDNTNKTQADIVL